MKNNILVVFHEVAAHFLPATSNANVDVLRDDIDKWGGENILSFGSSKHVTYDQSHLALADNHERLLFISENVLAR